MRTVIPAIIFVLIFTSCARKVSFLPSTTVPAATGTVKVDGDRNRNYSIKLSVTNLAEPERLTPPKDNYVVWVETEENRARNVGRLRSKKRLFSRAWRGELETVTSEKPVRIFITAEDQIAPQFPGQIVLNTKLFNVR